MNWVNIGFDTVMSPVQCQAIILTQEDFSSFTPQGTDFSGKYLENNLFLIEENALLSCRL